MPILGGAEPPPAYFGNTNFVGELDGRLRRYSRRIEEAGRGFVDSLPWAAVRVYCGSGGDCPGRLRGRPADGMDRFWILRHHSGFEPGGRARIPLEDLMEACRDSRSKGAVEVADSVLKDRIAILAPDYGCDFVPGPEGFLPGSQAIADAIESELGDVPAQTLPWFWELGLEVLLAILITIVHNQFMPLPALATMLLLAAGAVGGSIVLYAWAGYWTNFIVVVAGMWIEQLYEAGAVAQHDLAPMS
jgi:hypothetical protein